MAGMSGSSRWSLVGVGILLGCCNLAAQTVVVHDTFDVGEATFDDDPDDPLDLFWSAGFVVDDEDGIGDGNALEAGGDVWATFDAVTLEEQGDFVRLSFDFRFFGAVGAGGDASNGNFLFRAALSDVANEKTGYIIRIGTGGDGETPGDVGNGIGLRQNDDRAGPYGVDGRGVPVQNDTSSIQDNDPHSASLTMTMITGETTEDGEPTGELPGVRLDGVVDDVSVSGEFLFGAGPIIDLVTLDHIYFDDRGPDFIIDNVKVEFGTAQDRGTLGDLDGDGQIDVDDIDLLSTAIQSGGTDGRFDLNADGIIGIRDHGIWVEDIRKTWFGDANLDGEFNSADLVTVFQAGHYEDEIAMNSGWAAGDWNADGDFDSGDLVVAFQDGGYEQGPREPVAVVPEPSGMLLLSLATIGLSIVPRTRWKVTCSLECVEYRPKLMRQIRRPGVRNRPGRRP